MSNVTPIDRLTKILGSREDAERLLTVPRQELLAQSRADEGMFGSEVWEACEALKVLGWNDPFTDWLLTNRKTPMPSPIWGPGDNTVEWRTRFLGSGCE